MTQNQINYQTLLEQKNANAEQKRANLARELETARSNRANEALTSSRDWETARSNQARELETNRSNLARELETNRANLASEANSRYQSELNYRGRVDAAYINKHGASPTDIVQAGKTVGTIVRNVAMNPKVSGLAATIVALPSIAAKATNQIPNTIRKTLKGVLNR